MMCEFLPGGPLSPLDPGPPGYPGSPLGPTRIPVGPPITWKNNIGIILGW